MKKQTLSFPVPFSCDSLRSGWGNLTLEHDKHDVCPHAARPGKSTNVDLSIDRWRWPRRPLVAHRCDGHIAEDVGLWWAK